MDRASDRLRRVNNCWFRPSGHVVYISLRMRALRVHNAWTRNKRIILDGDEIASVGLTRHIGLRSRWLKLIRVDNFSHLSGVVGAARVQ